MTPEELQKLLRECWSRDTSADREHWTPENPAHYQCGPTILVTQDFFGGEILRGRVIIRDSEYIHKGSVPHFWNRLPGGKEIDFTREQFSPWERITEGKPINRSLLLRIPSMRQKYNLLKTAVESRLKNG